jgi:hypothetical protein
MSPLPIANAVAATSTRQKTNGALDAVPKSQLILASIRKRRGGGDNASNVAVAASATVTR